LNIDTIEQHTKPLNEVQKEEITYRSIQSDDNEINKINRASLQTKVSSDLYNSRDVGSSKPKYLKSIETGGYNTFSE